MATIKDRLNLFLNHYKISGNQFEKEIGASKGFFSRIDDNLTQQKRNIITAKYPNLNMEWLLTGTGEMLINPSNVGNIININKNTGNNNAIGDNNNISTCDIEIIKTQAETISKQQDTISKLTEMLLALSKK